MQGAVWFLISIKLQIYWGIFHWIFFKSVKIWQNYGHESWPHFLARPVHILLHTWISVVCASAPHNSTALRANFNSNSKSKLTKRVTTSKFYCVLVSSGTQHLPVDIILQQNYRQNIHKLTGWLYYDVTVIITLCILWHGDIVWVTPLRTTLKFLPEVNALDCHQQKHAGSKTLLQQNPPVLNWECWLLLTCTELCNWRKMAV